MKILFTTNHTTPIFVDDEDYERINKRSWYAMVIKKHGRVGHVASYASPYTTLPIANVVMQKYGILFDHIDRNPFNNQKSNLREATRSQNCMNNTKRKGTSSRFKGVSWYKKAKQWEAYINVNGKRTYLGRFNLEEDAARAYNNKAVELFKEFANLNPV